MPEHVEIRHWQAMTPSTENEKSKETSRISGLKSLTRTRRIPRISRRRTSGSHRGIKSILYCQREMMHCTFEVSLGKSLLA